MSIVYGRVSLTLTFILNLLNNEMVQVTYMYYTGRLEVLNENFLVVRALSFSQS
jgi:hypothetical protein